MKNRYMRNILAILIALAMIISGFYGLFSWSIYSGAGAADCSEEGQSIYYCDPSRYLSPLVFWCSCFAILLILAIVYTRIQLRNGKTKK